MKQNYFHNYLNVLFFTTIALIAISITFTLLTGMSPLEALNVNPLAATLSFGGMIMMFIIIPIVVKIIREKM
ncbi:MAG TPA: hypothetical protein ENJ82_16430 [Bacteroidetes bacterium]|nr:hypothetical protein [Bacteroidota bacterium]